MSPVEDRLRRELHEMADRVEVSTDSWTAITRRTARRARLRRGAGFAAAAAALVAVVAFVTVRGDADTTVATDATWSVDDLQVRERATVGTAGGADSPLRRTNLASDGGALWFTRLGTGEVGRFDPVTASVTDVVDTGMAVVDVAAAPGSVWAVADGYAEIARIDRDTGAVRRVGLSDPVGSRPATGGIAFGDRAIWVPVTGGGLARIDVETEAVDVVDLGVPLGDVTAAAGDVWGVGDDGTVIRVDGRRREVTARTELGAGVYRIEHGDGQVWVLDTTRGDLVRLSPDLGSEDRIDVGASVRGLAVGLSAVWVTDSIDGVVVVVDARSLEVRTELEVGGRPNDVAVVGDEVWISDPDAGSLVSVVAR
jgi:streptogramin lyase